LVANSNGITVALDYNSSALKKREKPEFNQNIRKDSGFEATKKVQLKWNLEEDSCKRSIKSETLTSDLVFC
jgi:hypothetical protein